jgi:AcrR family transcriptional regulator
MARPRDPHVTEAIRGATLELLERRGFARMSMEAVADAAGVGKPAIYRRFTGKADLVAAVIAEQLPVLDPPDLGDSEAELRAAMDGGFPADAQSYVGLIGGMMAEQPHHPELIAAFRDHILLPRRAIVRGLIERAQARGDVRRDLDPEMAIDLLAGPLLARAFAGHDTGRAWRERAFALWWEAVRA